MSGLRISSKRIRNVLVPLKGALHSAFQDGIILRDVSAQIPTLSHRTIEPCPFSPSEINLILQYSDEQTRNLFRFAFFFGLRTSELIALEWSDVDFQRGVVRVQRASVRKIIKTPKTISGERDVKLLTPAQVGTVRIVGSWDWIPHLSAGVRIFPHEPAGARNSPHGLMVGC